MLKATAKSSARWRYPVNLKTAAHLQEPLAFKEATLCGIYKTQQSEMQWGTFRNISLNNLVSKRFRKILRSALGRSVHTMLRDTQGEAEKAWARQWLDMLYETRLHWPMQREDDRPAIHGSAEHLLHGREIHGN